MVCEANLPSYSTKFLPYWKHIQLSWVDIDSIKMSNTNQCETLHSRVFGCVPKHTVWSRNFTELRHSVKHAACLGAGESLLKTVEGLGIPVTQADPFYLHMKTLDSISKFHGRHISTAKYKSLRYMRRKQKRNKKPRLMLNMTMALTQ